MRRRQGFTLVELLVAMALIVFIMAILAQAFGAASKTFRDLKGAGDLAERLRAINTMLRRDLAADHFEGKKRLSDPNFWSQGPPREGFFRIFQGGPSIQEGGPNAIDQDLLPSLTATNHILHFAVKLRGNQRSDFLSASVPALDANGNPAPPSTQPLLSPSVAGPPEVRYQDSNNIYNFQWAEVCYFLRPAVDAAGNQDTANGNPLFALYRRQRLLVPDNALVTQVAQQTTPPAQGVAVGQLSQYVEVSCLPDPTQTPATVLYFNSPNSLTMPARRFATVTETTDPNYPSRAAGVIPFNVPIPPAPPAPAPRVRAAVAGNWPLTMAEENADFANADLLLTDVVSFNVQVLVQGGTDFVDLYDQNTFQSFWGNNPNFPKPVTSPLPPQVFDTWSSAKDEAYDYSQWFLSGTDPTNKNPSASIPLWNSTNNSAPPVIKAIKVALRIWDFRTEQSRQVTIIQAM